MALSFLISLYISILCWMWGNLILGFGRKALKLQALPRYHFTIVCFLGFAAITSFAVLLSLFIPLGGWTPHLVIFIPCLAGLIYKAFRKPLQYLRSDFSNMSFFAVPLLCICSILVLLMSTSYITHEDTLGYHSQIIYWIEKRKAVPGIVHLHSRYGLQNSWFCSCALFSFSFLKTNALTFINSTVVLWYIFFVVSQAGKCYQQTEKNNTILWLFLLFISLWSYTQIRLTTTSASPDFIATLYIWLIFYLLLSRENRHTEFNLLTIIILAFFAITIKLSALPVILTSAYALYKLYVSKKPKVIIASLGISLIILSAYSARNIISSGYAFFPSLYPNISNVDWKLSKKKVVHIQDYIASYARTKGAGETGQTSNLNKNNWIFEWWQNQFVAEKTILLLAVLSFLILGLNMKKIRDWSSISKIALLSASVGILFWFAIAPDPRFGLGFLVMLPALIVYNWPILVGTPERILKKILWAINLTATIAVVTYTIYRFVFYFSPKQFIQPLGIKPSALNTFKCTDIEFHTPENANPCGNIPIPCTYTNCATFEPRGRDISDGFRAKE